MVNVYMWSFLSFRKDKIITEKTVTPILLIMGQDNVYSTDVEGYKLGLWTSVAVTLVVRKTQLRPYGLLLAF